MPASSPAARPLAGGRGLVTAFVEAGRGSGASAERLRFAVLRVTGGCREFLRGWLTDPDTRACDAAREHLSGLSLPALTAVRLTAVRSGR